MIRWAGARSISTGLPLMDGLSGDPSPVINWDFLQSQSLTSFSRTSNATLFDSTGKLTYAANNTAVNSAVYNTNWTLAGISSITTGVSDPVGGTAASSMVEDGTTGLHRIYSGASSCFTAVAGVSYLVSLDIKPGIRTWTRLFLGGGPINGGLGVYAYFNLSGAGSVGTATATSPGIVQLANGWYRAYFKVTAGSAGLTALYIEGATADTVNSYAGSNGATAVSVYNLVSAAVTYETTPRSQDQVITTANPYYGPRYPYAYNGSTWDAQGLLVEAAGTNTQTYSSRLSGWSMYQGTPTLDAATSPEGVSNAVSVVESTANGLHQFYSGNTFTTASGTVYTFSIFAKANGRTRCQINCQSNMFSTPPVAFYDLSTTVGSVDNVDAGCSASIQNVGNGWYRLTYTFTANSNSGGNGNMYVNLVSTGTTVSYVGNASLGMYFYGSQFEASDRATSYIPNLSTGTTTRNADTSLAFSAISLPTGLSFSRASNAMQYDAAGRLTYAPHNILGYSEDFRDTATAGSTRPWTNAAVTVVANTGDTTAPDGTTTADKITEVANTGDHRVYLLDAAQQRASAYCVFSIYLKDFSAPNASQWVRLEGFDGGTANGQFVANFDLTNGVVGNNGKAGGGGSFIGAAIQSVGNGWYRCSIAYQQSSNAGGPSPNVGIYLLRGVGNIAVGGSTGYAGSTSRGLYGWGAQFEFVTYEDRARPYMKTSDSNAVYGPRYDYDPTTRLPKGLLVEEGRTNIATNTETFTGWAVNATAVNTGVTSPSGSTSKKLDELATTAEHTLYLDKSSQTTATFSCYMKMAERRYASLRLYNALNEVLTVVFDLLSGVVTQTTNQGTTYSSVTSNVFPVGNGWFRCSLTSTRSSGTTYYCLNVNTTGTPTIGTNGSESYLGVANNGIYIYGAQLEAGSFPTSYIPNPGIASGIRSADVATVTGANFSSFWNATEGTFYFAGASNTDTGSSAWCFSADDGTLTGNSIYAFCNGAPVTYRIYRSGNLDVDINTGNRSQGVKFKVATAYKANDAAASLNGAAAIADTSVTLPTVDRLNIGKSPSSQFYLNGHIAALKYWRARLSNAKLQTETA